MLWLLKTKTITIDNSALNDLGKQSIGYPNRSMFY